MPTLPTNFIQKRVDVIIHDLDIFFGLKITTYLTHHKDEYIFLKINVKLIFLI
jgi:hypothetical protein